MDAATRNLLEEVQQGKWGVILSHANLKGENLSHMTFFCTTMCGINLRNATLMGAVFKGCDLYAADLRGADLRYTQIIPGLHPGFPRPTQPNLEGADLRGADLRGANLEDADNLDKADLRDASYDNTTIWPTGFNPSRAGARKV